MKRQFIFICIALLSAPLAKANFITDCKFAYRTSADSLVQSILQFKDKKLSARDLGYTATSINIQVTALRGACYFAEPVENRACVEKYMKIYEALKLRVNAADLINGNQQDVEFSWLDNAILRTKVKNIDYRCEF